MLGQDHQLFREGAKRVAGGEARRYNLLAARLIANLVKTLLGPRGLDTMFIDILGEVTVTKDGATLLRKIDIEHPAAKLLIEASNAVDNAVGDGTTSVVVLAGALVEKAEDLLEMGFSPTTISDGYLRAMEFALGELKSISVICATPNRKVMEDLAKTCLRSKAAAYMGEDFIGRIVVDAVSAVADFTNSRIETDDIKIEEKPGSIFNTMLVSGIVIDKTIDSSSMPRSVDNAKILLLNEDLDSRRTRAEAEIHVVSPGHRQAFVDRQRQDVLDKVQKVIDSGARVVISQAAISLLAQNRLAQAGIISVRMVKENDIWWLEKATGSRVTRDLDNISERDLGFAKHVYEKFVGDDKMVFVEGCREPKAVTILLHAGSKRVLDELHRSTLGTIAVLKDFILQPSIVAGGGSIEVALAKAIRKKAAAIEGREQMGMLKFADALEEIPLTIARNAGMDVINTQVQLRAKNSGPVFYGINAIERKVDDMFALGVVEPTAVKEQVIKTAAEVVNMLVRVDDVLMARPTIQTHTHSDGTTHSHEGGNKTHDHFDKLGKKQRPIHHYY